MQQINMYYNKGETPAKCKVFKL